MDIRGDGIFPEEVVIRILARLPVKTLFRSKTVCKLWYRLSLDKYFIQLYNEETKKNPMILMKISDSSDSKSSFICVDNLMGVSKFSLDFLNDRVKVRASCNGLLCCSSIPDKGVFYVCNPVTREFRLLPKSREWPVTLFYPDGKPTLIGLACDSMFQKFNVVLAGCHRTLGHRPDGSFMCLVFDSELNKWRKFILLFQDDPYTFTPINNNQVVFVNNAMHWLTASSTCILVVDLSCDVWRKKPLPYDLIYGIGNRIYLLDFDGCLSVIQISEAWMKIWVLKDYWIDEWCMVDKVSLRCIRGMVLETFPVSQTSEYVFLATHKQVLVYHRKSQVWKEMSTLPLWFSAHAYRSTMFSCN